jgi:hypothetical protein
MISYEYECWKCDKWHADTAPSLEELEALSVSLGFAYRVTDAN